MNIEEMRRGDPRLAEADALLRLALPTSAWMPSEEIEKAHGCALLASVEERVVGALVAWVVVDEVHLLAVAVADDVRRAGVGVALLDALRATAVDRSCTKILLEVGSENHAALALYRRRGFEVVHTRRGYYADGSDGVEMQLTLA